MVQFDADDIFKASELGIDTLSIETQDLDWQVQFAPNEEIQSFQRSKLNSVH